MRALQTQTTNPHFPMVLNTKLNTRFFFSLNKANPKSNKFFYILKLSFFKNALPNSTIFMILFKNTLLACEITRPNRP
jgi:hypothetical protein